MRVYDRSTIKVNATTKNNRVVLDAEGTFSPVVKPILTHINNVFGEEKPVSADEDRIIFSTWLPPIPSSIFGRVVSSQIGSVFKRRIPDQFSIGITMKCPNNCIHCGAADVVANPELSLDEINNAVTQSIDLGSYLISFDGGETMLRKDLEDMVENVDKERAIATVFTSGYGLTEQRAQSLKNAGLYAVRVSFDSPFEDEHDKVRGRDGAYQDAISAVKNAKSANLLTDMFVVVSPDNIDNLKEFYDLAVDLGVDEISLYEIVAVGRWLHQEDQILNDSDVSRLETFQKNMNAKSEGPRVTAFPYIMGPKQFGCFAGRRWIHVTSAGDVLPCAYTPLSFGNIREDNLKDIWKRMGKHSAYKNHADYCMMRNPEFRKKYIHTLPDDVQMPYRMDKN
ncbi:Radical SAM domain protein [Methanohalobium evestigatum Z-7303]|uniref:Radical SAM domain protein n=2 Tax=root TaxID=1 RepID=D7E6D9_METEZ|nr:radical SAM protein [Methanohalobium evestigatum]ADI73161.1 Radical SAM domain protein [Methanohalobium evestigatum Z-7303]AGF93258.1 radical SAM domain-containing protein [uncultured organism]